MLLHRALQAQALADAAYFDPALVSRLYFPDDQKHAIYIPLFVPAFLPVFFTLVTFLTYAIASVKSRLTRVKQKEQ